jgi:hypothetical protein
VVFSGSIKKAQYADALSPAILQSMDELIDDDFDRRFGCHS